MKRGNFGTICKGSEMVNCRKCNKTSSIGELSAVEGVLLGKATKVYRCPCQVATKEPYSAIAYNSGNGVIEFFESAQAVLLTL